MGFDGLLLCSYESAIGTHPKPDIHAQRIYALRFILLLSFQAYTSEDVFSLQDFS